VRAKLPVILKNRAVDYTSQKGRTNYRYEDLAGIAAQIDPMIAEEGLFYRWRTIDDGKRLTVVCTISHRDGYSEENSLSCAHDMSGNKNDIQAVGAAQTYLQRYTLKASLGLAASNEDDDGRARGAPADNKPVEKLSEEQVATIVAALEVREMPEERFLKWARAAYRGKGEITTISDLPAYNFQICLDKIRTSGDPQ
jgi:hypothetical protein